jgi:hypothetical protein
MRRTILVMLGTIAVAFAATSADAQTRRSKRPVIVVRPDFTSPIDWYDSLRWRPLTRAERYASSRVVRQCVDGYAIERRPSGTVITPQMRCRWVVR